MVFVVEQGLVLMMTDSFVHLGVMDSSIVRIDVITAAAAVVSKEAVRDSVAVDADHDHSALAWALNEQMVLLLETLAVVLVIV